MSAALPNLPLSTQLIGVDGGASGVRAWNVELLEARDGRVLQTRCAPCARLWPATPGWRSPAQRGVEGLAMEGPPDALELDQAWKRVETTARCVLELARARGAARVLVGVAMPGIKTEDSRGIAFARHGPRCPRMAEQLETLLRSEGLEFAAPIGVLHGDGASAGVGEEYAADGLLRDVACAYYLGGGTGLAEALKLRGERVPLEQVEDWFPRAWRLREPFEGQSYDDVLSARGINELARWRAGPGAGYPEDAVSHDERVQQHFALVGRCLATLVVDRVVALRARSPQERDWPGPHELTRVVVGLRLGQLLADERTRPWFERQYCDFATARLRARKLEGVHWSTRISTLSAAPAIGAAALALFDAAARG